MAHAKSPWSYGHPAAHIWAIRDADGALIAEYHGANSDDNPHNEGTVRLMTAAPELASVCIGILECLEADDPWTKQARKNAAKSIRAALEKAGAL